MKSKNQEIKEGFNPKNIKAVIFDWGGVMCREAEPFASKALQQTLQKSPEQIAEAVRPIYNDYYKGVYTRDEFWNAVLKHFRIASSAQLNPEALSLAYRSSYVIYPRMFEFAAALRAEYCVGLLSNLTPEMRDHVQTTHHLENFFHTQVYSCDNDVAAMKPDPLIFHVILRKMKVLPAEALFIDNSNKNVEAAAHFGLHTIFFVDQEQCLDELAQFLKK